MPKPSALERELHALATQLRKVEAEYTMYFSGRGGRPPVESRAALDRAFKRFDRAPFDTPVVRFQFTTLLARYSSFSDLWDRGVRAREEGRGGPLVRRPHETAATPATRDELVHEAAFRDPGQEVDTLRDVYDALMQARRDEGHGVVPFHEFVRLVREQVRGLQERHPGDEVRIRVSGHERRVKLTARAVKVAGGGDAGG